MNHSVIRGLIADIEPCLGQTVLEGQRLWLVLVLMVVLVTVLSPEGKISENCGEREEETEDLEIFSLELELYLGESSHALHSPASSWPVWRLLVRPVNIPVFIAEQDKHCSLSECHHYLQHRQGSPPSTLFVFHISSVIKLDNYNQTPNIILLTITDCSYLSNCTLEYSN